MSGFTSFKPFSKPNAKFDTDGMSIPPTNPNLLVLVIFPAINPTEYPASSSLNSIDLTLAGVSS